MHKSVYYIVNYVQVRWIHHKLTVETSGGDGDASLSKESPHVLGVTVVKCSKTTILLTSYCEIDLRVSQRKYNRHKLENVKNIQADQREPDII